MRPFAYERASRVGEAVRLHAQPALDTEDASQYLAGGTTLLDLMKIDVLRPRRVIDISALRAQYGGVKADENGLHLGALARMSEAADHPLVRRDYPMLAQSLDFAASAQLRNMATLAGNVLQRTRCHYFRDVSNPCNKREPGAGCAAIGGVTRLHAVLGTSEHCIASYAGDFAQALIALDAQVDVIGPGPSRSLPFADLHRAPGTTPHIETALQAGELITAFRVPARAWSRRSLYRKVRDRASYAFALASAAVALDLHEDGRVRAARIALGGVATKPWRAHAAEASLRGQRLNEAAAEQAAHIAFEDALTQANNSFKPELGRRTLVSALLDAAAMEL